MTNMFCVSLAIIYFHISICKHRVLCHQRPYFVRDVEVERLLESKAITKADVMKLPCMRKNRKCLADHIKHKSRLHQSFNKGSKMAKADGKLIDEVLKLMIADNADTLRDSNDDEVHLSKSLIEEQKRKSKARKEETKKLEHRMNKFKFSRSDIQIDIPDFINTYKINEFNLELRPNKDDPLSVKGRSYITKYLPIKKIQYSEIIQPMEKMEVNKKNEIGNSRQTNDQAPQVKVTSNELGKEHTQDESVDLPSDADTLDYSDVNYQNQNDIKKKCYNSEKSIIQPKSYNNEVYNEMTGPIKNKRKQSKNKSIKKGTVFDQDGELDVVTDSSAPSQNNSHTEHVTNSRPINQLSNTAYTNKSAVEISGTHKKSHEKNTEEVHLKNISDPSILLGHNIDLLAMKNSSIHISRDAQENLFRNRSKKYPIDSSIILKKLGINIKTTNKSYPIINLHINQNKMNATSAYKPILNNKTLLRVINNTAVLNSSNVDKTPLTKSSISSFHENNHVRKNNVTINVAQKDNITANDVKINNATINDVKINNESNNDVTKNNVSTNDIKINNVSTNDVMIDKFTAHSLNQNKSKNFSLKLNEVGSKRDSMRNISADNDLDNDFDFEDSYDNSLQDVVTMSDSEIDDGDSNDNKNGIFIESNEKYQLANKRNESRSLKMHLKDAASLTAPSLKTVRWNFLDNFDWDDYINQYPFSVVAPVNPDDTESNLVIPSSDTDATIIGPTRWSNEDVSGYTNNNASTVPPVDVNILPKAPPVTAPTTMTPFAVPQPTLHKESLANYVITTPSPPTFGQTDIPNLPTTNLTWAQDLKPGKIKASRVCKPGVPLPHHVGKKNCLIIGDSIALSYSYAVAADLKDHCQVQLAPISKAGVALDSSYGLECLEIFLSTANLFPTYYDVVLFNFGLHDIDYLDRYPEEYNNLTSYLRNLKSIKMKILETGATPAFVLSTPVTFDAAKDAVLKKYNHEAKRVMEEKPHIMTVNLHKLVIQSCGKVPFDNCYMMKKPNDVHYGVEGSTILGKRIAYTIKYLLEKRSRDKKVSKQGVLLDLSSNATQCNEETSCPMGTTCMTNIVSRTGAGCCMLHNGVDCGDSWHCCPHGTVCHPACSDRACSCIK